ncbi:SDR family NAD(P)-dependent oxidoreductase [Maribellus maritimus]|uniref:SDR family NAD(P)-dependent oxidoreductase n=1 Tax=Maribellus maritimus TaxID=2870838 RepID=UPI001EECEBA4|nr:SDR family NAD(P)-dependent oxidoreductase [Maribellus maritimus]MCG6187105.1 SDR family NAD(P)-dependent oxidoreductase [Maribellus maritimus]
MNILITGTSSGLGFGFAKYYLENGNTVFGISRKINEGLDSNENFHFLSQDVTDFERLPQNIFSFLQEVKQLDLVILNAGMLSEIKDLKETQLNEIQKVMDVNVWANKLLIDALTDAVKEIKQIVAISSGASVSGSRGWNAYSLSKATLNMLINLYAKEFPDIHFCALAPGLIDTKMQDYIYGLPENEKFPTMKRLKSAKGTEQMPTPENAAGNISKKIERLKNYESGLFLDVRKM